MADKRLLILDDDLMAGGTTALIVESAGWECKGFLLSIDDFGTGFSSMLQLVRLPFSEIKIDKSFVMTALLSAESRAVIRSIVELGQSLSLSTSAEGVEHPRVLEFLRSVGV